MNFLSFYNDLPEELEEIFSGVREEYERSGAFFLERSYILRLNSKFNLFPNIIDELLHASDALRCDAESAAYALFVYRTLCRRELFDRYIQLFDFDTDRHPYIALFILLPTVENTYADMVRRDLPEDIIEEYLCHYEECVAINEERHGYRGLEKRYFKWLLNYVDCKILNIDRLRFEIAKVENPVYMLEHACDGTRVLLYGGGEMKSDGMLASVPPHSDEDGFFSSFSETDDEYIGNRILTSGRCSSERETFKKSEYRLIISPSDTCLSVHIPPRSKGPLTAEACDASYRRALEIFREHYPELDIKAIRCRSWMLSHELRELLPPDSNIITFQRKYALYPINSGGNDVFTFVFRGFSGDTLDLPEETSLQRAIKRVYLDGGYIYESGGIFPVSDVNT